MGILCKKESMAKRKNDTENKSVVQNDAITEVKVASPASEQANDVSETIQTEFADNSSAQNDYVIEMRHITKEFPGSLQTTTSHCNSNAAKSTRFWVKTAQANLRLCPFFSDCINPKRARF